MTKYKIKESKDNKNAKGVVSYRTKVGANMKKVVLGEANQAQLADLHSIGHPFVEEVKAASTGK